MARKTTLEELGQMLSHVVEHMATNEELTAFRMETAENFRDVRAETAVGGRP